MKKVSGHYPAGGHAFDQIFRDLSGGLEAGAIALGEVAEGGRVFAGEEGGFASESVNPKIAAPAPHIRSQLLHRRFHADPFGPSRDFSDSLLKRIQGLGRHNALSLRAGSKAEPQKFPLLRRKNPSRIQCSRKRTVPRAPNRFNPHKGRVRRRRQRLRSNAPIESAPAQHSSARYHFTRRGTSEWVLAFIVPSPVLGAQPPPSASGASFARRWKHGAWNTRL
jgi:hypothetical protein